MLGYGGRCRSGGGSGGRDSRVVGAGNTNARAEPWYNNRRGGGGGREISWGEASNVTGFHGCEISLGNIISGEPSTVRAGRAENATARAWHCRWGRAGNAGERAGIAGGGTWRASPKKRWTPTLPSYRVVEISKIQIVLPKAPFNPSRFSTALKIL